MKLKRCLSNLLASFASVWSDFLVNCLLPALYAIWSVWESEQRLGKGKNAEAVSDRVRLPLLVSLSMSMGGFWRNGVPIVEYSPKLGGQTISRRWEGRKGCFVFFVFRGLLCSFTLEWNFQILLRMCVICVHGNDGVAHFKRSRREVRPFYFSLRLSKCCSSCVPHRRQY